MKIKTLMAAAAVIAASVLPVQAAIISEGITYTAASANLDQSTAQFLIQITGINGVSDTRDGRYGVESFAFNNTGLLGTPLSGTSAGYTFMDGGLNASGCNGDAAFFCFSANVDPTAPPLPAESVLNIFFSLTVGSGNFLAWAASDPSFKINWLGTEKNYDLVSLSGSGVGINPLDVSPVPIPAVGAGLPGIIGAAALFMAWRRRRQQNGMSAATPAL